jgi:hypothetical protein
MEPSNRVSPQLREDCAGMTACVYLLENEKATAAGGVGGEADPDGRAGRVTVIVSGERGNYRLGGSDRLGCQRRRDWLRAREARVHVASQLHACLVRNLSVRRAHQAQRGGQYHQTSNYLPHHSTSLRHRTGRGPAARAITTRPQRRRWDRRQRPSCIPSHLFFSAAPRALAPLKSNSRCARDPPDRPTR